MYICNLVFGLEILMPGIFLGLKFQACVFFLGLQYEAPSDPPSCILQVPPLGERFGFEPWPGHCVVFLGRHFTLTVPLFTQVYKWVPANLLLGVTLRSTSIPSRGE